VGLLYSVLHLRADLGSLRGLFVTFLLLYFVDILVYLNFG
jgi:hypothetical protein